MWQRRNKYNAKKVTIDGITFDSKAEARRYAELKLLIPGGLEIHPAFPIFINNVKVCVVELDFAYTDDYRQVKIYEDVKGRDTAMSRLKRKMVEAAYGITVKLIKR